MQTTDDQLKAYAYDLISNLELTTKKLKDANIEIARRASLKKPPQVAKEPPVDDKPEEAIELPEEPKGPTKVEPKKPTKTKAKK